MVVHLVAEPKHLLRLVPVELSLSLGHPALLLALQLLAEGHAELPAAKARSFARAKVSGHEAEKVYTRYLPLTSCQEGRLGLDYTVLCHG